MLMLAMLTGIWFSLAMVAFLVVCGVLVLTVMIQKPQGGGLSAAFGASSGSGQTAFGTKTGDALTVATILVFVVWLLLAVTLNIMSRPASDAVIVKPDAAPATTPATTPETTPAPAPTATPDTTPPATPAGTPAVTPGVNEPANGPIEKPAEPAPSTTPATTPAPTPAPGPAPGPGEPAPR